MSGTSLDGLDVAYCIFKKENNWKYQIKFATTYKYGLGLKKTLSSLHKKNISFAKSMDVSFGKIIAQKVQRFINDNGIKKIDLISSHGHTVFHQPEKKITLQIGCGQTIANITSQQTINNFRKQDVLLKGQGAPLVPIGDHYLFNEYDACINLGGFANTSYCKKGKRIAYDICPCNIILNLVSNKKGIEYDKNGMLAKKGKVIKKLLDNLNDLDFYKKPPPKSLGLEWVKKEIIPHVNMYNGINNVLRTLVEHIAIQVSKTAKGHSLTLLTGGGANNIFLTKRINTLSETKLIIPSKKITEYKEALIFSFLGVLKKLGENNVFATVTGAKKDHSSGDIYYPKN